MQEIQLTRGKATLVDDEDYEMLRDYGWYVVRDRRTFYARASIKNEEGRWITIKMHRMIMNVSADLQVDHIDGNGLNNQKNNLRVCTSSQNAMNRRHKPYGAKSKYKGVVWMKDRSRWRAQIKSSGRNTNLGDYLSEELAAKAYNAAAKELFGEHAALNKVEDK